MKSLADMKKLSDILEDLLGESSEDLIERLLEEMQELLNAKAGKNTKGAVVTAKH